MENQQSQMLSVNQNAMQAMNDDEQEIDLLGLAYELLDKIKYIILSAIIGALIAGVYSFVIAVPQYESTAKLYVLNSSDSVVNLSDLQLGNYLASDYTEVFKTWEVNEMVRTNLSLPYNYKELEEMVSISNPADTRILYITVTSPSAQEATLMANEYAKVVSDYVEKIMATDRPNTLSVAIVPTIPISPNKTQNIILGFLLGVLLAIGIVTARFILDDAIRSADDVTRHTGYSVLAVVPTQGEGVDPSNKKRGANA